MQTQVILMRPSVDLEELYLPFYKEWKESGENMIPWVIGRDPSDFAAMVQYLRDNEHAVNIPEGWVPSTTYWLVTADVTSIVGAVNIRHRLNEKLLHRWAYRIWHPSFRKTKRICQCITGASST